MGELSGKEPLVARKNMECGTPVPLSVARLDARLVDGRQDGLTKAVQGYRTP